VSHCKCFNRSLGVKQGNLFLQRYYYSAGRAGMGWSPGPIS